MKKYQILILALAIICLFPIITLASTVEDAEKFWANKQGKMAFTVLENIITDPKADKNSIHLAWFTYGKFNIQIGRCRDAVESFTNAYSLNPMYEGQIKYLMLGSITQHLKMSHNYDDGSKTMKAISNANTLIKGLYLFTPKDKREEFFKTINEMVLTEVNTAMNNGDMQLADEIIAITPGWKDDEMVRNNIYEIMMDYGEKADDNYCLMYYSWAAKQKIINNKNKIAAARLWSIAKQIEFEQIDKDFKTFCALPEEYRKIARIWDSSYPPKVINISSGVDSFVLEPGEILEHWVSISPKGKANYSIEGENGNQNYIIIFENGKMLNSWETPVFPFNIHGIKFKIKQLKGKNVITLTINK